MREILRSIIAEEQNLLKSEFLAPCVPGGQVRTRVQGMVYTFVPSPRDFEGWGVFVPMNANEAKLREEASLPLLSEYLQLLKPVRMILAHSLQGSSWLAYPANESDARQQFGAAQPYAVHVVSGAAELEQVVARWDGGGFWFEEVDRRADPLAAEQLRGALRQATRPEALRFKGLTPEMRTAYELAAQQAPEFEAHRKARRQARRAAEQAGRDQARVREALRMGGGELYSMRDGGTYWTVEWTTRDGERHTSAIAKRDLTVISAGICLSGEDRKFDLQSLVGVVESSW